MSFIDDLAKVAERVGMVLGGPAVPAVVEIAKDFLKLLQSAREVVTTDDLPKLEAMLVDLEPKVLAHADSTEDNLRHGS